MAIDYVRRQSDVAPGRNSKPNANPLFVDSDDDTLKFGTGASGTSTKTVVDTSSTQTLAAKTLTTPAVAQVNDTAGTNRAMFNSAAKTIVDGSATGLFSVACPALSGVGGFGVFLVRASDGTEFQADAGIFTYSGEAKTTTVVGAVTYVAANEAKSVSSGTLTLSFTADVSVANVLTIKVQPTGSLTETAPYTIEYTLFPIRGAVTIL